MLKSISQPLPYTSSPALLAAQDLWLFISITFVWPITKGLPSIILPFYPWRSGPLDELYPSIRNLWALTLHIILLFTQATFLILLLPSLFFGVPVPLQGWTPACILTVVGFVVGNSYFCVLLNGTKRRFESISNPEWQEAWQKHDDERWIFINGIAAGDHWMQSNLDRLALSVRRQIFGIHNKTQGILFDAFESIVQRTFGYATLDIRDAYTELVKVVEDDRYKKVVLILHSQGAIEGGLVLDWLFATTDRELLKKLEVYTFGSAANHFSSPITDRKRGSRVIKHIEHYANNGDPVCLGGILHFRPLPKNGKAVYGDRQEREEIENLYVGKLFVRNGSGHQMNGNYLDNFFCATTDDKGRLVRVEDDNEFVSSDLNEDLLAEYDIASKLSEKDEWDYCPKKKDPSKAKKGPVRKIKDVSRLWLYRNGRSPDDRKKSATR